MPTATYTVTEVTPTGAIIVWKEVKIATFTETATKVTFTGRLQTPEGLDAAASWTITLGPGVAVGKATVAG